MTLQQHRPARMTGTAILVLPAGLLLDSTPFLPSEPTKLVSPRAAATLTCPPWPSPTMLCCSAVSSVISSTSSTRRTTWGTKHKKVDPNEWRPQSVVHRQARMRAAGKSKQHAQEERAAFPRHQPVPTNLVQRDVAGQS